MFRKTYKRKENKGKVRGMTEKNLAWTRKKERSVLYRFYSK